MARLQTRTRRAPLSLQRPTAVTTTANLVILGGYLLSGVVSARALGPAGRGQLTVVMLWSGLIHVVGTYGLQSSCSYHLARWPDRRTALVTWLGRIAIRQVLTMTAVSAAFLYWLRVRLHLTPVLTIESTTWPAAMTLVAYGASCAQGMADFRRFNLIRVISGATPAVLMIVGAVSLRLTPADAVAAYLVPAWCGAVIACAWLRQAAKAPWEDPLTRRERRAMLSYGRRSLASHSGLTLNNSSDQLTLALLVPASAVGLYTVSSTASSPLPFLIASFGMVGLPTVAALAGPAKAGATSRVLKRAACLLALAAPLLAALLPWCIPLLYGRRYSAAVVPAELLLLGRIFAAMTRVTDDLLRAHGLPGFGSIAQGAGAIVTITGTLLLARAAHPLAAVSAVSSLGFALTFFLALTRLWAATRRLVPGHAVRGGPVGRDTEGRAQDSV
ncbi:MAG TPA: hypothetical protein DHU96_22635 [Actinobacteria bacterium]|nr:hypothetical protein [Actinomycetota bacterium]